MASQLDNENHMSNGNCNRGNKSKPPNQEIVHGTLGTCFIGECLMVSHPMCENRGYLSIVVI